MEQFVYVDVDLAMFFLSPVPLKIQTTCSPTCHNDAAFDILVNRNRFFFFFFPLTFVRFYGHLF